MFHYVTSKKRNTKAWFQNPNVSLIIHILNYMAVSKTCPKGFGLKLAKLGLKTPLKK